MLAHDVSLPTLLGHSLHYEGTPGLWHCLLKLLQALHLSFTAARWIAGAIAAAGTAVLLAYAPFPRIVRLLLPFSFFLAYQDAVIARSYVLFAVFAFAAAAMLRSGRMRPLGLALVLGLMANISLHAALASGGLALVAAVRWRGRFMRNAGAVVLLLLFWLGAVATMAPAEDVDFSAGNNLWRGLAKVEQSLGIHVQAPPPINALPMADLARKPLPVHLRVGAQRGWNKFSRTLAVITYPLSLSRSLALLLFVLVVMQGSLRAQGSAPMAREVELMAGPKRGSPTGWIGLVPYLLMVVVFTSLYLAPRHVGMVFTTFVVAAWLTWPERPATGGRRRLLERLTAAAFAVVLIAQLPWTAQALVREHRYAYSPDRMTAEYLKQQGAGAGTQVAGFYYYSVGPLLYFDRNIYTNQPPHRYWFWGVDMRTYATVEQVLAQHTRIIVVGGYASGPDAEITRDWQPNTPPEPGVSRGDVFSFVDYFSHHGYHETRLFCGHSWMRASYTEQVCDTILERNAEPTTTVSAPR